MTWGEVEIRSEIVRRLLGPRHHRSRQSAAIRAGDAGRQTPNPRERPTPTLLHSGMCSPREALFKIKL